MVAAFKDSLENDNLGFRLGTRKGKGGEMGAEIISLGTGQLGAWIKKQKGSWLGWGWSWQSSSPSFVGLITIAPKEYVDNHAH